MAEENSKKIIHLLCHSCQDRHNVACSRGRLPNNRIHCIRHVLSCDIVYFSNTSLHLTMGESLQNFLFFFLGHCKESFIFNLPPENLYFHWLVQNIALLSHWPTLIRANVLPRRIFHFSILPKWVGQWAASGPEIPPPLFPQGAKLAYGAR